MSNPNDHGAKTAKTAAGAASLKPSPALAPVPKTWAEVKVGSLVIAHESEEDGWWEAIVTEIKADKFIVRWRDYPHQKPPSMMRKDITFLPIG